MTNDEIIELKLFANPCDVCGATYDASQNLHHRPFCTKLVRFERLGFPRRFSSDPALAVLAMEQITKPPIYGEPRLMWKSHNPPDAEFTQFHWVCQIL